jgi:predicted GIY-YIG superfamily endonuclease
MWEPAPGDALTREGYPYVVYYLFDHDLETLYIGRTSDVMRRFAAHSTSPWWPEVATYGLEFFREYADMFNAERAAILEHHPQLNVQKDAPAVEPPREPPVRRNSVVWREDSLPTATAARRVGVCALTLKRWADKGIVTPAFTAPSGRHRWDLNDLRSQIAKRG